MSLAGQRPRADRYAVIPRTLTFLVRQGQVLLLRVAPGRGAWSGQLNGYGGHIERGEDPLSAARREILEESGLTPQTLRLCGVVLIDLGSSPGIGLYVFVGQDWEGDAKVDAEGTPELVPVGSLDGADLVEDLPELLPRSLAAFDSGCPFSARYSYSEAGDLQIEFGT